MPSVCRPATGPRLVPGGANPLRVGDGDTAYLSATEPPQLSQGGPTGPRDAGSTSAGALELSGKRRACYAAVQQHEHCTKKMMPQTLVTEQHVAHLIPQKGFILRVGGSMQTCTTHTRSRDNAFRSSVRKQRCIWRSFSQGWVGGHTRSAGPARAHQLAAGLSATTCSPVHPHADPTTLLTGCYCHACAARALETGHCSHALAARPLERAEACHAEAPSYSPLLQPPLNSPLLHLLLATWSHGCPNTQLRGEQPWRTAVAVTTKRQSETSRCTPCHVSPQLPSDLGAPSRCLGVLFCATSITVQRLSLGAVPATTGQQDEEAARSGYMYNVARQPLVQQAPSS